MLAAEAHLFSRGGYVSRRSRFLGDPGFYVVSPRSSGGSAEDLLWLRHPDTFPFEQVPGRNTLSGKVSGLPR